MRNLLRVSLRKGRRCAPDVLCRVIDIEAKAIEAKALRSLERECKKHDRRAVGRGILRAVKELMAFINGVDLAIWAFHTESHGRECRAQDCILHAKGAV